MSLTYELWQAERKKTKAEQREIDRILGQVVAALVELWSHPGKRPIGVPAQRAVPVDAKRVSPLGVQAEVHCDV